MSRLPTAIAAAIDALPGDAPALVYDLAAIERRMAAVVEAARPHGVRVLFAMKSFPHEAVVARAAAHLDGFDAGSPGEVARVPGAPSILSVTDPCGAAALGVPGGGLIVTVETAAQAVATLERHPAARLAVRLAASHLVDGPEAVGGVLEDTGARTSRFGVRPGEPGWQAEIAAVAAAARGRLVGVHVHHGGIAATSPARLVGLATAALAAAEEGGLSIEWLDLGGGLHGLADRLPEALTALRAAVPPAIELAIEPGRLLALGAGYAVGHVRAARELADRSVRVLDLSRACHLRWQRVQPLLGCTRDGGGWREMRGVLPARTGLARKVLFAGPTCYEEDVVGEWKLGQDERGGRWPEGSRLVLGGVDGYALAWNTGFGGITAARVAVVG